MSVEDGTQVDLSTSTGFFLAGKAALSPLPAVPELLMSPWLLRDLLLLGMEQILSRRKALGGKGSRALRAGGGTPVGPSGVESPRQGAVVPQGLPVTSGAFPAQQEKTCFCW